MDPAHSQSCGRGQIERGRRRVFPEAASRPASSYTWGIELNNQRTLTLVPLLSRCSIHICIGGAFLFVLYFYWGVFYLFCIHIGGLIVFVFL